MNQKVRRIILGISGASGAILGIECLKQLRQVDNCETHLIISSAAHKTIQIETKVKKSEIEKLADYSYNPDDIGATIASGSFLTSAMIVAPCSIKTLSDIVNSHASTLMSRAADVALKEGRPLLLMVRETPLHLGHLKLMKDAVKLGAIIFPPIPNFYSGSKSIEAMVEQIIGRALFRLGIPTNVLNPWDGG